MSNIFQNLRFHNPPQHKYNLSHEVKCSMRIGNLYPVLTLDVLPGDKFNVQTQHVLKLQPMLAPIMHNLDAKIDYFYVPYRLLSKNFNEFVLGIEPTANPPYLTTEDVFYNAIDHFENTGSTARLRKFTIGTLWDFLGYPTPTITSPNWDNADEVRSWYNAALNPLRNDVMLSAMPILAFRCIWSNYYRWNEQEDASLWEEEIMQSKNVSHVVAQSLSINEPANWQRDYFTSAMTQPQAGDPVSIQQPLENIYPTADDPKNSRLIFSSATNPDGWSGYPAKVYPELVNVNGTATELGADLGINPYDVQALGGDVSGKRVQVDVSNHTKSAPIDVEVMREAFILQRIKQLMQVGGSKPIDRLKSLWGVNSSDARLQVPEYLGGGRSPVVISSVMQQVNDAAQGYALGQQAGQGLSVGKAASFNKYFEEHGIIIGIMRIVPKTAYYQGVSRDLLRVAQGDFAMPQLSVLGEQAIKNCELYFASDDPEGTFGYQSRYADYKYKPDRVHGDFRTPTLDYWHMARRFDENPKLSAEFQKIDAESVQSNVFAYGDTDTLLCDMYHSITAKRKLTPNIW